MKPLTPDQEWQVLISDYNRDNAFIKRQKYKWLPPKPTKGTMKPGQPIQPKRPSEVTKESPESEDGPVILPKKKTGASKQKKSLSPVMQVMKAVASAAQKPAKKKKPTAPPSEEPGDM